MPTAAAAQADDDTLLVIAPRAAQPDHNKLPAIAPTAAQAYHEKLLAIAPTAADVPAHWLPAAALHLCTQIGDRHPDMLAAVRGRVDWISVDPSVCLGELRFDGYGPIVGGMLWYLRLPR